MALGANLELAQIASIVGLHGLTLAAAAIFAAPATLWTETRRRWLPTALAVAALAAIFAFGAWRISAPASPTLPNVKLRLMQPNVAQGSDFSPDNGQAIVQEYLALSDRATSPTTSSVADVTHLIWPELAFPFLLARDGAALAAISEFLRGGTTLVTGAARLDENDRSDGRRHFFNSILTLDRRGLLPERYDKRHLVPFGEYLPFGRWFERIGVTQFVHMPGGFDPGTGADRLACSRPADRAGVDLLRGDLPQRARRKARRTRSAALDAQRHRRRLVRPHRRALPAFRPGAAARDRDRPAARSRRQHRHFRGGRRPRPQFSPRRSSGSRRSSTARCPNRCRRPGSGAGGRRPLAGSPSSFSPSPPSRAADREDRVSGELSTVARNARIG